MVKRSLTNCPQEAADISLWPVISHLDFGVCGHGRPAGHRQLVAHHSTDLEVKEKMKKKFDFANVKVPHTYVILFTLIILAAIMTYVIPAGVFDMVQSASGKEITDPDSFHYVAREAATLMDFLSAPFRGMMSVADLIFFVFITGGSFQIITGTGTIETGITRSPPVWWAVKNL